jgi:hypothetical protein
LRVPPRQREVLRRYDLSGEPAIELQRGLGISTRQFFRDRRAALTELAAHLPNLTAPRPAVPAAPTLPRTLNAQAEILQSSALTSYALELERLLRGRTRG